MNDAGCQDLIRDSTLNGHRRSLDPSPLMTSKCLFSCLFGECPLHVHRVFLFTFLIFPGPHSPRSYDARMSFSSSSNAAFFVLRPQVFVCSRAGCFRAHLCHRFYFNFLSYAPSACLSLHVALRTIVMAPSDSRRTFLRLGSSSSKST